MKPLLSIPLLLCLVACDPYESVFGSSTPLVQPCHANGCTELSLLEVGDGVGDGWRDAVDQEGQPIRVRPLLVIPSEDIVGAAATIDDRTSAPVLQLQLSPRGGQALNEATRQVVGKRILMLSGDNIITLAFVSSPMEQSIQITGPESFEAAKALERMILEAQ